MLLVPKILKNLNNDFIIKYKESFLKDNKLCIVMEYANGGDLYQMINDYKKNSNVIIKFSLIYVGIIITALLFIDIAYYNIDNPDLTLFLEGDEDANLMNIIPYIGFAGFFMLIYYFLYFTIS